MAQIQKRLLTGSTNGRAIKVVATASAGTLIHTAITTVTTAGMVDEVWLWACNDSGNAVLLTVQWGGTTVPDDSIPIQLAPNSGDVLVCAGKVLNGGVVVRAFASVANVVVMSGYANVSVAG